MFMSCAVWLSHYAEADMVLTCSPCWVSARLPACLSVYWPQNCFYKCRNRCSIALQPNRITRLFSYSRVVERRERLVLPLLPIKSFPLVQERQRTYGTLSCLFFLSILHLFSSSLALSLYYSIFPLCPDFTKPSVPTSFTSTLEQIYISGLGFSKCWLPCHWILHT